MGQPTPPGDIPLYEGLSSEWNDVLSAIPEDKRAEIAPKIQERFSSYEPLKQWEDFQKSGITADQASTALNIYSMIENNPRQVYDALAQHLNITPAQAKEVVEDIEENGTDSEIEALRQQVETLAQIALAERQQTTHEKLLAEQEAKLDEEIKSIQKKYGNDIPEDEILMRMMHKNITAEEAYKEYSGLADNIRSRRPSPMILGNGGTVPPRQIDPTKLDNKGTKLLVAQMLDHANAELNK